jgi:hypothetical protein
MEWKDGKITKAVLHSAHPGEIQVSEQNSQVFTTKVPGSLLTVTEHF